MFLDFLVVFGAKVQRAHDSGEEPYKNQENFYMRLLSLFTNAPERTAPTHPPRLDDIPPQCYSLS